jgi:hypothetical protein
LCFYVDYIVVRLRAAIEVRAILKVLEVEVLRGGASLHSGGQAEILYNVRTTRISSSDQCVESLEMVAGSFGQGFRSVDAVMRPNGHLGLWLSAETCARCCLTGMIVQSFLRHTRPEHGPAVWLATEV